MGREGWLCSSRHWVRSTGKGNEATAPAYRLAREAGHTHWLTLSYPPRLRTCLPFYRRPSACLTETHEDLQERSQQLRELSEPQTGDPPVPARRWAMEEAWSMQRTATTQPWSEWTSATAWAGLHLITFGWKKPDRDTFRTDPSYKVQKQTTLILRGEWLRGPGRGFWGAGDVLSLNLHVLLEYVQIVQIYLLRFVHVSVSFCCSNIYTNKVLQYCIVSQESTRWCQRCLMLEEFEVDRSNGLSFYVNHVRECGEKHK